MSMEKIYVLRAAAPGVPPVPPGPQLPPKPKKNPKSKEHLGPTTQSFRVVYESKGYHETQRFEVPSTEPYEAFLDRMAHVSTPVAGSFIAGRESGFTKDDGPWRYALASRSLGIEHAGAELSGNIMYQAMISELLKADSPWNWAILWHDIQKGPDLKRTRRKTSDEFSTHPESADQSTSSDALTTASEHSLGLPSLQPFLQNPPRVVPPAAVSEDGRGPPTLQSLRQNPPRVLPAAAASEDGRDPPTLQFLPRVVPPAAASEDGREPPTLHPFRRNPPHVLPAAAASEDRRGPLTLQPLPRNPPYVMLLAAISEYGRRLRPLLPMPPSYIRPVPATTAVLEQRRELSRLQPVPHNPERATAAVTAAPSSCPLPRNATCLLPPLSSNSLFNPSPYHPPSRFVSPITIQTSPSPHHPFHSPHHAPSSRTPVQVIACRTDYARRAYLVQWIEPGVPESWESEDWIRDNGWGCVLDDFFRRRD